MCLNQYDARYINYTDVKVKQSTYCGVKNMYIKSCCEGCNGYIEDIMKPLDLCDESSGGCCYWHGDYTHMCSNDPTRRIEVSTEGDETPEDKFLQAMKALRSGDSPDECKDTQKQIEGAAAAYFVFNLLGVIITICVIVALLCMEKIACGSCSARVMTIIFGTIALVSYVIGFGAWANDGCAAALNQDIRDDEGDDYVMHPGRSLLFLIIAFILELVGMIIFCCLPSGDGYSSGYVSFNDPAAVNTV